VVAPNAAPAASDPTPHLEGETTVRNPPVLVSIIGFFAALAGFTWLFLGLRILGFDWFGVFGDLPQFESAGLWGWFAILGGVLWIAAAVGLWSLQPWAWMAALIVAGFSLFEAFVWMFRYPGSGIGLSMSLLPLVVILYLNSRDVKAQFGISETPES
jgi:hypothetical protein